MTTTTMTNEPSNSNPRVSIGMPVYNGERYLREALDSLLAQTFTDSEIIISDNASTDATELICRAYAEKDSRVIYHRSPENRGAAWNYNRVFDLARGEFFRWAAHDDLWAPEFDAACVKVLDNNQSAVLSYSKVTNIDEDGCEIEKFDEALHIDQPRPHQRFGYFQNRFRRLTSCSPVFGLIRSDALRKTPRIGHYVDSDRNLLAELLLIGAFHEIPEFYLFRRVQANSSYVANISTADRAKWFDPNLTDERQFKRWKWLMEHIRSIRRVPLGEYERFRCYLIMVRWCWWQRRKLWAEAKIAVKRKIRRWVGLSKRLRVVL